MLSLTVFSTSSDSSAHLSASPSYHFCHLRLDLSAPLARTLTRLSTPPSSSPHHHWLGSLFPQIHFARSHLQLTYHYRFGFSFHPTTILSLSSLSLFPFSLFVYSLTPFMRPCFRRPSANSSSVQRLSLYWCIPSCIRDPDQPRGGSVPRLLPISS